MKNMNINVTTKFDRIVLAKLGFEKTLEMKVSALKETLIKVMETENSELIENVVNAISGLTTDFLDGLAPKQIAKIKVDLLQIAFNKREQLKPTRPTTMEDIIQAAKEIQTEEQLIEAMEMMEEVISSNIGTQEQQVYLSNILLIKKIDILGGVVPETILDKVSEMLEAAEEGVRQNAPYAKEIYESCAEVLEKATPPEFTEDDVKEFLQNLYDNVVNGKDKKESWDDVQKEMDIFMSIQNGKTPLVPPNPVVRVDFQDGEVIEFLIKERVLSPKEAMYIKGAVNNVDIEVDLSKRVAKVEVSTKNENNKDTTQAILTKITQAVIGKAINDLENI